MTMVSTGPTVIKLGGSILEDASLRSLAITAIANAWKAGESIVIVHGGGKKIDSSLAALGIEKRTHKGLRITDEPTLEIVVEVLAGIVNKTLVAELTAAGVPAAGFSVADGGTIAADIHAPIEGVTLGMVGKISGSNPTLIRAVMATGMLPVIGSVALGRNGQLLNVNADSAAAAVAVALSADRLIYLTDVDGLLDDRGKLIPSIKSDSAKMMVDYSVVRGGMLPKLQSAVDAVTAGVARVVIAGPKFHTDALLHGEGGTHLVAA